MTFLANSIRNAAPLIARQAAVKQTPFALSAVAQKRWKSNTVEVRYCFFFFFLNIYQWFTRLPAETTMWTLTHDSQN